MDGCPASRPHRRRCICSPAPSHEPPAIRKTCGRAPVVCSRKKNQFSAIKKLFGIEASLTERAPQTPRDGLRGPTPSRSLPCARQLRLRRRCCPCFRPARRDSFARSRANRHKDQGYSRKTSMRRRASSGRAFLRSGPVRAAIFIKDFSQGERAQHTLMLAPRMRPPQIYDSVAP